MNRDDLTVVILAAGKGTRLEPISLKHAKALTPILGVPILARLIEDYRSLGLTRFVVVTPPGCAEMDALLAALRAGGPSIANAVQTERRGTAHALMAARELIAGDFVLCSCDNLFPAEHLERLLDEHLRCSPPAVITLEQATPEKLERSAGVRLAGTDVIEIVEKPGRDDSPSGCASWHAVAKFLFTFERRVLDYLDRVAPSPRGELELQDALAMLMADSDTPPRGVFAKRCLHLTCEQDLIDIHEHYLARPRPYSVHDRAVVDSGAVIRNPVQVEPGARIGPGAVIGPVTYVGAGATVGPGARVEWSVVYAGATVGPGEVVSRRVRLP